MIEGDAIDRGKVAADDHLQVGLQNTIVDINLDVGFQGDGPDRAIRAQTGIERAVQRAVAVQARDVMPVVAVESGEVAADDDVAVGLQGQRGDEVVRPAVGRDQKRGVHIAAVRYPHDPVIWILIVGNKTASEDGVAVRLLGHGIDRAAGLRAGKRIVN